MLRDVAELDESPSDERAIFAKQLKRIFGDGMRLKLSRDELGKTVFDRFAGVIELMCQPESPRG